MNLPNGIELKEDRRTLRDKSLNIYFTVSGATITGKNNRIMLSIFYTLGGLSYLSGETSPRGYYVSVTPVSESHGCISMRLFNGFKKLLQPAKRYSAKTLPGLEEDAQKFLEKVLLQHATTYFTQQAA